MRVVDALNGRNVWIVETESAVDGGKKQADGEEPFGLAVGKRC